MNAYDTGYLIGQILAIVLVPAGIFLAFWLSNRNKPQPAKGKALKLGGIIAAIAVVVIGGLIAVGHLTGGPASPERMIAAFKRGCTNSCQKRRPEAWCTKYCDCVGKKFVADVGRERVATLRNPKDMPPDVRTKLIAAALQCRKQ